MKGFGFYKSKKYLQRVMLTIMTSMVLILVVSSITNTYMMEKSVKRMQENSNLKVLSQIQYNLAYMNDMITRLSNFVYRDNFLIPLMFSQDLPKMDLIRGHRQMANIMESTSFLDSMVIYNKAQGELYGTSVNFMLDGGITKDRVRDRLLGEYPQPTNRLIPISLSNNPAAIDTFAFIVTDSLKSFTPNQSAIILFIKSDWVFDSLKKMNVASSGDQGEVYIQTQDGRLLTSDTNASYTDAKDQGELMNLVQSDKATGSLTSGFVIGDVANKSSMVTYMDDGLGAWTILYIQDYDLLMSEVTKSRNNSLLLAGIFLLLAIALSIWLSYKLYHPIENMIKQINPYLGATERKVEPIVRDELGYMSENFKQLSAKLKEISSEQIVSKYYVRKFLTDSLLFSHIDMQHLIDKHQLKIGTRGELLVCVLKFDNFATYDSKAASSTKLLYNFAIVNIAAEIMGQSYPCEAAEMRGDHFVLILTRGNDSPDLGLDGIATKLKEIQLTINNYYGLSLTCGISDPIEQFPLLSSAYAQALRLCQYKLVKGHQAIITTNDVRANLESKQSDLPETVMRKLSEALKKGQLTNAGGELERAFSFIAECNYDDMVRAVSNIAFLLKNIAGEINDNRIVSFTIDMENLHQLLQEKETLDEMYVALLSICTQICEGQRPANMERNEMMLETVKELIEQRFSDINLSQQSIASTVKLSSAYIGKLFKESYQLSITEYINEVRLTHAQKLLEGDNYTISEIMDKCGYANQSYFFRLFKGKVGSTPKEYRMKKSIS
ncbi:helix-turn-helix domain-containing protein [Paenibacillus sp. strain BS8-2]